MDGCAYGFGVHVQLERDDARTFPSVPVPENVKTLRVWHCKHRSLEPLRSFTNLRGLEIATFPDSSLEALSELQELRYLRLLHLPKIGDLGPLGKLTSLVTLRLETLPSWDSSRKTTTVASLAPLAHLKELQHIELYGVVPADGSLRPLEACSSLESAAFHLFPRDEINRFFRASGVRDGPAPSPDF
jgi:hypothetical protein